MTPATSPYKNFWGTAESPECPPLEEMCLTSDTDPHVTADAIINGQSSGMAVPKVVQKWWGYELHYKNDDQYCAKWLHFEPGGHTSLHYHVGKHETLIVASGILTVITQYGKETNYKRIPPGGALVVCPGYAHRLIAAEGPVDLIEASTTDFDDDSVRIS